MSELKRHDLQVSVTPMDARRVANFFLNVAEERHSSLTHLTLQKLIYFAHGWHLAATGQPLILDGFEAWEYGPVVRQVYDQFKSFGSSTITSRATIRDLESRVFQKAEHNFPDDLAQFLLWIYERYARHSAYELSRKTHEPGSPWDQVWNDLSPGVKAGMRIGDSEIAKYFRETMGQRMKN